MTKAPRNPLRKQIRRELLRLAWTLRDFPTSEEEQASQDRNQRLGLSEEVAISCQRCLKLLDKIELNTDFELETCERLCDVRDRMLQPVPLLFAYDPEARRAFEACAPFDGSLPIVDRGMANLLESATSSILKDDGDIDAGNSGGDSTLTPEASQTRGNGSVCADTSRISEILSLPESDDREVLCKLWNERHKPADKRQSINGIIAEYLNGTSKKPESFLKGLRRRHKALYESATDWSVQATALRNQTDIADE